MVRQKQFYKNLEIVTNLIIDLTEKLKLLNKFTKFSFLLFLSTNKPASLLSEKIIFIKTNFILSSKKKNKKKNRYYQTKFLYCKLLL